jgi:hypothetical protein
MPKNRVLDSAQHCLDQSAECRRLMKLARSEAEAQALKISLAAGQDLPDRLTDTTRSRVDNGASSRTKAASGGSLRSYSGAGPFRNLDLTGVVDVFGYLAEITHVEPPAAAGAFQVMFRLGRCGVVDVAASMARHSVRRTLPSVEFDLRQQLRLDPAILAFPS